MNVLSLFDGISCGRVALERAGVKVDKYYASEIDKYAIQVSQKNWPDIIQVGDITKLKGEDFKDIDLIIGGSPCQDLSNYKYDRGDVKGLEGEKSSLFYHYIRLLKEIKPKYFLLENVASMDNKWKDLMSEIIGVQPIMINSNLVCAAERKRYYWTNIPNVIQPDDKNIKLKDIVLPADKIEDKYWYDKPFTYNGDDKKVQCTLDIKIQRHGKEVYNLNGKCNTILCDGNGGNLMKKVYQDGRCRKLTPLEYERLQTLPDNYSSNVSNSRRYTAIGNGWTVDVIAHILKNIPLAQQVDN